MKNGCVDYIGTADNCVDYYTEQSLMGGDTFDFANRKTAHKRAYISDFAFVDAQGNTTSSFSYSDVLSCKLGVKSKEDLNVTARITLFDVNHSRVMAFDSQDVSSVFPIKEGKECTLCCHVQEALNIKPGRYSVNISIRQGNELLDHIENVSYIDVREEDFYGYGRFSAGDMPICLRHHTWTIK